MISLIPILCLLTTVPAKAVAPVAPPAAAGPVHHHHHRRHHTRVVAEPGYGWLGAPAGATPASEPAPAKEVLAAASSPPSPVTAADHQDSDRVCIGGCATPARSRNIEPAQVDGSAVRSSVTAAPQVSGPAADHSLHVNNVSSTTDGRGAPTAPIGGHDLCDPSLGGSPAECSGITEAHPGDFQRPERQMVSPESILIDNAGAGKGATTALPASVLGPAAPAVPAVPTGGISVVTLLPPK